jgi:tRNA A-37 threonylcarbamoyl transferase component Bud32
MTGPLGSAVRVGGLDGVLLARSERGDGRHQVVSARLGGREVVLKLYGRKRAWLPTWLRGFGHRFLVGKTGLSARLLALWRSHGFAVPELVSLTPPEPVDLPLLVMERVSGSTVDARLRDANASPEELEARLLRFAEEWSRRHGLAEQLSEPGLVHAHPGFAHVIDRGGVFTYFDFEYAYTDRRRVAQLVDVEIAGFVASLRRAAGPRAARFLRPLVAGYRERARLERVASGGALGRFRALEKVAGRAPFLRGRGPRKLRESIAALRGELERSR